MTCILRKLSTVIHVCNQNLDLLLSKENFSYSKGDDRNLAYSDMYIYQMGDTLVYIFFWLFRYAWKSFVVTKVSVTIYIRFMINCIIYLKFIKESKSNKILILHIYRWKLSSHNKILKQNYSKMFTAVTKQWLLDSIQPYCFNLDFRKKSRYGKNTNRAVKTFEILWRIMLDLINPFKNNQWIPAVNC